MSGWRGVDLDGTLAEYGKWQGPDHIGAPVPLMVFRVKEWLLDGIEVRIMTARVDGVFPPDAVLAPAASTPGRLVLIGSEGNSESVPAIRAWCERHVGQVLTITNRKDYGMIDLWDDRAIGVIPNTGARADGRDE